MFNYSYFKVTLIVSGTNEYKKRRLFIFLYLFYIKCISVLKCTNEKKNLKVFPQIVFLRKLSFLFLLFKIKVSNIYNSKNKLLLVQR